MTSPASRLGRLSPLLRRILVGRARAMRQNVRHALAGGDVAVHLPPMSSAITVMELRVMRLRDPASPLWEGRLSRPRAALAGTTLGGAMPAPESRDQPREE